MISLRDEIIKAYRKIGVIIDKKDIKHSKHADYSIHISKLRFTKKGYEDLIKKLWKIKHYY